MAYSFSIASSLVSYLHTSRMHHGSKFADNLTLLVFFFLFIYFATVSGISGSDPENEGQG